MKKIIGLVLAASLCATALFGQVLGSSGINNTLSTNIYQKLDNVSNGKREGVKFHGFDEKVQIRVDLAKFTMDGMLQWTLAADQDPVYLGRSDWYLNFLFHPFEGFDFGMGTNLNWSIGAAPTNQGKLAAGYPWDGSDVVGSLYYANTYTAHQGNSNGTLGVRYRYDDFIEAGIALPSGNLNSDSIVVNLGFKIKPIDLFDISIAYDGIFQKSGNLYIGSSWYFSNAQLDAYIAANFRPESYDLWGFGAGFKFGIPRTEITFRPELGFTFYTNDNYTFAWNTGIRFDLPFAGMFNFGAWMSFAWGAEDTRWPDDYTGGFIFNIHPDFSWNINSRHTLKLDVDYENRKSYKGIVRDRWQGTLSWVYKY